MPAIKNLGGSLYHYTDGLLDFKITLISNKVIQLYGDIGYQYFSNPRDIGIEGLPMVFKDDSAVYKSAQIYTEGVTNKAEFMKEVDRLLLQKEITEYDKERLKAFNKTHSFCPETVTRQLMMMGYSPIAEKLRFYEHDPRLIVTCEAFIKFLKHIPNYIRERREDGNSTKGAGSTEDFS
jgi:hypothetical protein